MSDITSQLLATFDTLPKKDQHELIVAMLRRSGEVPGEMLTDEQLVGLADELFQTLDAEEADGCTDSGSQ